MAMGMFNNWCQKQKFKPQWEFESISNPQGHQKWRATLVLPGPIVSEGVGQNKKVAQQIAVTTFLEENDIALSEVKASPLVPPAAAKVQARQKEEPSWLESLGDLLEAGEQKALPTGPAVAAAIPSLMASVLSQVVQKNMYSLHGSDRSYQAILGALRCGQADKALVIATQTLQGNPGAFTFKQLLTLLTSISVRTPLSDALELLSQLAKMMATEFPDQTSMAYFYRQSRWNLAEFVSEGHATIKRVQNLHVSHILEDGLCVRNLVCARKEDGKPAEFVLRIRAFQHSHKIQKGDWCFVTFPPDGLVGASIEDMENIDTSQPISRSFEAEVLAVFRSGFHMKFVFPSGNTQDLIQMIEDQECRLDRAANHIVMVRQNDALRLLVQPTREGCNPWVRTLLLAQDEEAEYGTEELLCAEACGSHYSPLVAEPLYHQLSALANGSQSNALRSAVERRVCMIQGPPGSGKTHTAVLLIQIWSALGRTPILACAESNVAVDNLVRGLVGCGIQVVRLGRPESSSPELEEYTLEKLAGTAGSKGTSKGDGKNTWTQEKRFLEQAQVICATCHTSMSPYLENVQFRGILIDECAQATEQSTVMPFIKLHVGGSVTMIGDHKQLPPTVLCQELAQEGATMSLFDRFIARGVSSAMLGVQYRMHPAIADFSAQAFYEGNLRSGVAGSLRIPPTGFDWPQPHAGVMFLHSDGTEHPQGTSYWNEAEARIVLQLLNGFLTAGQVQPQDVGVISPYSAQVRLLRRNLGTLAARPGSEAAKEGNKRIEVSSVDGFQGREKELIILSTVRANENKGVGFLTDARRLNVSLTRARRGLVVVGHYATLARDTTCWAPWLQWAQSYGFIVGAQSTPDAAERLLRLESAVVDGVEALKTMAHEVAEANVEGYADHGEDGTPAAKRLRTLD